MSRHDARRLRLARFFQRRFRLLQIFRYPRIGAVRRSVDILLQIAESIKGHAPRQRPNAFLTSFERSELVAAFLLLALVANEVG